MLLEANNLMSTWTFFENSWNIGREHSKITEKQAIDHLSDSEKGTNWLKLIIRHRNRLMNHTMMSKYISQPCKNRHRSNINMEPLHY